MSACDLVLRTENRLLNLARTCSFIRCKGVNFSTRLATDRQLVHREAEQQKSQLMPLIGEANWSFLKRQTRRRAPSNDMMMRHALLALPFLLLTTPSFAQPT